MTRKRKETSPDKLDPNMKIEGPAAQPLRWLDPKQPPLRLAGFAWMAQDGVYRRLPVKPAWPIRDAVDSLANCTAGGQIQFQTDSSRLFLRVKLRAPASMDHMPATGQCGFDGYIGPPGAQKYAKTTRFNRDAKEYEVPLFENFRRETRNVTLNFPLYQGVNEVFVGLDPDARVEAPPARARAGRVIVYGTSVTQGGCAARPGMLPTNILSRRLNIEFINLGFSGNGRGEPELARLIAQIEAPLLYVLDYDANCKPIETLRQTLPEFIRILREDHPETPILVVSCTPFSMANFDPCRTAENEERKAVQRETVERRRAAGDRNIAFLDGMTTMGEDFDECTVDGTHPTDLGFLRIADAWTPIVRRMALG